MSDPLIECRSDPVSETYATFLTWTEDNLLRQVVYEGLREDKLAAEVRRELPRPLAQGW